MKEDLDQGLDLTWKGARLSGLVRRVFGGKARVVGLRRVKRASDYWVLLARIERPEIRVVIKLAGDRPPYPCEFERSAAIYRRVATHTEIEMPEIYAVDETGREWPGRYMIKTYIEGVEWARLRGELGAGEHAAAQAQLGRAVAQLHAMQFAAFGELGADGELGQGGGSLLNALAARARTWIADRELLAFFLATLDGEAGLFGEECQASLTHEDLHGHNILYARGQQGWRLATILDFDKAWAGHAESDLARLELWRGMASPAFWEAYRAVRPIDPGFARRRLIYQLLWCLEYAAPTAVHWADTQGVCEALGIRLPKTFVEK
jgi:fructosamine-3-kinase